MKKFFPILIFLIISSQNESFTQTTDEFSKWFIENYCSFSVRFTSYDYNFYSKPNQVTRDTLTKPEIKHLQFLDGYWQIKLSASRPDDRADAMDFILLCRLEKGVSPQTSVSFDFAFNNWSAANYVLMPGAVYNGNRFESRRIRYSPKLLDPRDIGPDIPVIISDVPRLNINDGPSRIQERSGGMTVPAIGFRSDHMKTGFWLLTEQGTKYGDTGIGIEESRDRKSAVISLTVPVVRENYQYYITDNQAPSKDRAPDFKAGDEFTLKFRVFFFHSSDIQSLFDRLADIRKDVVGETSIKPFIPFSSCFSVQEEKFNNQNWVDKYGYYSVGMRENFLQDWQIGWTGGMISTYPLLFAGNETSRQNVLRNFDWLFPNGICPAGFFWDSGEKGTIWYGGDIRKPNTKNWHLVRKSGDGLYYVIKQFMLMEKMKIPVKDVWKSGAKTVADAFVKLWYKRGQFGQFIDSNTGDIIVGGSTSGAIVPAALVLAGKYYNNPEYLGVAEASAEYFYNNYVIKGITCGGPGDAMQNPDSESSYAMLESFMQLYETTSDKKWLGMAKDMAGQFSSWVMAYDFMFPEKSTLGKLGVQTTGTVAANTQNQHEAPGICTYSGIALWRLFRATGDIRYMKLLKEIASVIPQYLSHPLRSIERMKPGWISERVNTTDWLEGIGELMYGSTWAETSLMLSYVELPGVYVQPDRSFLCVIDNIDAKIVNDDNESISIKFTNPTKAVAVVKLFSESSASALKPLGENALFSCEELVLDPGKSKLITFKKIRY